MSGYLGFDVLTILTSLFILVGSPGRDPAKQLFSVVPHQIAEDSCGQSVIAGLTGHYPKKTGEMSLLDMEEALLDKGVHSRTMELPFDELLPLASNNYPVIILLSSPSWHYVLLIGQDMGMAVIADPSEGTIALDSSRLSRRFSGWAIVPLLNEDDTRRISAELRAASNAALGRASMIRRKFDLDFVNTRQSSGRGAGIQASLSQSLAIGDAIAFMAEVSSKPSVRLELGGTLRGQNATLEACIGLVIEDFAKQPQPYSRAEGTVFRDPIAYFLEFWGSNNLEAGAGLIYAVNDKAAFEGGLRLHVEGWAKEKWTLDLLGGVHLAIGAVMCSIRASSSLEGSGGNVTVAVNF